MLILIQILSRLPLKVLYAIADYLIYPLMYWVVRYRRDVVAKNLRLSFPDKTAQELLQLEKDFYHHFANTIVEIIYGYRISDEEMRERMQFDNVDEVEQAILQSGGVFYMLGHIGNWEWMADIGKRYTHPDIIEYNVYRKQKNESIDQAMLAIRAKRGGGCIEKNALVRQIISLNKVKQMFSLGLISDQKPTPVNAHFWTTFLHQETSFLIGGETLAKKFNYPLYYAHMRRTKRGYYRVRFIPLSMSPSNTAPYEVTQAFAMALENNIIEQPELWLWTHNRWKYPRPQQTQQTT